MIVIDETTRTRLTKAFFSTNLHLGSGVGDYSADPTVGERCTIAEINLVLTGILTDRAHPCISEVIRNWVIGVQDAISDEMRNSVAWRTAAIGIAGSADSEEVEQRRVALIRGWMWDALSDEAVLATIPNHLRPAWDRMLTERTFEAADAARAASDYSVGTLRVHAFSVGRAVTDQSDLGGTADLVGWAVVQVSDRVTDISAYWERRTPAKLLAELIELQ